LQDQLGRHIAPAAAAATTAGQTYNMRNMCLLTPSVRCCREETEAGWKISWDAILHLLLPLLL
jgi:hypothetical protein